MRLAHYVRLLGAASVLVAVCVAGSRAQAASLTARTAAAQLVAAAGDIACDPSGVETPVTCHQRETSELLLRKRYKAVLALGDEQYETGTYDAFMQVYDPTWGRVKRITHPVPGNHEYETDPSGYFRYFGAAAGQPGQGWYSFNRGAWHLIALNSNCRYIGGCGAGSPEGNWLRADLARDRKPCTLAYFHHPLFTSEVSTVQNADELRSLWEPLYAARVDLIVNGHAHVYERFAPQDPDGKLDPQNGIREFVVGTGGDDFSALTTPRAANSLVSSSSTFGILSLTLKRDGYSWRFIPEDGGTFTDAGSKSCHQ